MAGKPIEIQIDAETRGAEQGVEKVADALDDAAKSADKLGDVSDKAGAQVEDAAKDAAKVVDRDLTAALKDAAKAGKKAGDDIGDGVKKGAREAGEGVGALKENTAANAKEMGASFSDVNSVLDSMQGLAAEALEGFGAKGIAAGVGVAAAIGLAGAALQAAADKANALTEEAISFADEMQGAEDISDRVAVLRDRWSEVSSAIADARSIWEVWQPRAITNIEQFAKAADLGAVNLASMFDAFNDPNPVTRLEKLRAVQVGMTDELEKSAAAYKDRALFGAFSETKTLSETKALLARKDVLEQTRDAIAKEIATQEAAIAITEARARAEGKTVEQYKASQAALERSTEIQGAYQASLKDTGDAVGVYEETLARKTEEMRETAQAHADSTKETTGQAADSWEDYAQAVSVTTDDLIADWTRQAAEAQAFQTNLATIAAAGGQALADELRAKGPEVAGAVAAVLAEASPEKRRDAIAAHASATGAEVGRGIAAGVGTQRQVLADAVNGFVAGIPVPSLTVAVKADPASFNRTVRELQNGVYQVLVKGKPVGMRYE